MIGELGGLGCAVGWAAVSAMMRTLTDRTSPVVVNGFRCAFAALTLAVLAVGLGRIQDMAAVPIGGVAAVVLSGVLGQGLGDAAFVKSMKTVGASRALPISGVYPLVTLGLAMVFLGERVTWVGTAGTLLVVSGVYLLAFPYGPLRPGAKLLKGADRGGVLMALLAACLWSAAAILLKLALADVDVVLANLIRMATATTLLFGLTAFNSRGRLPAGLSRRFFVIIALAGSASAFSSLGYVTAVYYAGAAKAAVLTSTSPLFGLPLSFFFLRERINARIVVGSLLSVAGLWLVLI